MTDKAQLITELGQLETEVAKMEAQLAQAEADSKSSGGGRTVAALGILVGILLLFYIPALGGLLILAGGLAYLTQYSKSSGAKNSAKELREKLATKKGELAAKRTQIMMG